MQDSLIAGASGREPGGQPGRMGQARQRVDKPDRIEEVLPLQCKHCGTALPQAAEQRQTAGEVFCRQIEDLPEVILPVVTEYQYPKLVCPCCQKGTRAEVRSEHVHQIGEQLTAAVSYLISARKITRRDVQATLQDLFGVDLRVGSVQRRGRRPPMRWRRPTRNWPRPALRAGVESR